MEKISLSKYVAAMKGKADLQYARGRGRARGEKPKAKLWTWRRYLQHINTKEVIAIKYKELLQINKK